MGKKKLKIKFIDKSKSISFHLVAKANHAEDGDDDNEDQEELEEELAAQREEDAKEDGADDDGADDSFIPPPVVDDRINLLNLAAAAEGIDTRAVRLAKKAAKASKQQKFYLQPNFTPGKNDVQIPKDFPSEFLYTGMNDRVEEEYWYNQDKKKYDLEVLANAPSLLPHNYEYDRHLRSISGNGVFMEAKRGEELYEGDNNDPRDIEPTKNGGAGKHGASSSSSSSSSSSASASLSHPSSSAADDEDDTPDPILLASVERYQRQLVRTGRRVRAQKDFVAALEGEKEDEFEELNDDFVLQAMQGAIIQEGDEPEEVDDEFDEECGEYDEYYEDEDGEYEAGEEYADEDDEKGGQKSSKKVGKKSAGDDDEDGDDDDGDLPPASSIDAAFDALMDEYDDDEIGELDNYVDDNPEAIEGALELDDVAGEMDAYLNVQDKFKSEGGRIIDSVSSSLQSLTLSKLDIVLSGEKSLEVIESEINDMLNPPVRETWDAESILSTYSNTENHPRVLREGKRDRTRGEVNWSAPSRKQRGAGPLAAYVAADAASSASSSAAGAQLPIPASVRKSAAAMSVAEGDEDDNDDDDLDDAEAFDDDADSAERSNRGAARAADESLEDKKKRKAAVKLAKREAKGRKKELKTLYSSETTAAVVRQARLNKANPPGVKKL